MTTILIVRHGNTFGPQDTPVRVGIKTDMPLANTGKQQAKNLGHYLKQNKIRPVAVFTSNLKRTKETASIAIEAASLNIAPEAKSMFDEVDYGPDEGKTNEEIIERIGERALQDWESKAVIPQGWVVNADQIVKSWSEFAAEVLAKYPNDTVMVVTSNGIARFATFLTKNFFSFGQTHQIKLGTGAIGALKSRNGEWEIVYWNEQPKNIDEGTLNEADVNEMDVE